MGQKVVIDWDYSGKKDFVNGTGAYFEEKMLGYIGAMIIPALLVFLNLNSMLQWNYFQMAVAMVLGFDLGGGMISNALNSGKRFYHSEARVTEGTMGKILKNPLLFGLIHVHPFVVGLFFNDLDWVYGLQWYLILIGFVLIIYKVPLYLKRPFSMLAILVAILLNSYFISPIEGFGWFIPVLFLKMIYGHMVREEPYSKSDV